MNHSLPSIELVDTTLREGYQSAIPLFRSGISPALYAEKLIESVRVQYVEIYGPGFYYSMEDYKSLVSVLGSRLQLYCGPVNKFDPANKTHIKDLDAPRLSFTVIEKSSATLDTLKNILSLYPSSTLRLGIECAGTTDMSLLMKFLQELLKLERVVNITLSDSNGKMTPHTLNNLITNLPEPFSSTLGFHLHNDRGLAVANALSAYDTLKAIGQRKIAFDYTYAGLGERYGLLSLQEIAVFEQQITKSNIHTSLANIDSLFTDEALHFHRLPYMKEVVHIAASHFDDDGKLRQEYRISISNGGSHGQ